VIVDRGEDPGSLLTDGDGGRPEPAGSPEPAAGIIAAP
jgi:hypothetical protein